MSVFHQFGKQLQSVVKERFHQPTHIQQQAIPPILQKKNTLVIAETGSGKTETVLLPVFDLFLKKEHKPISILYLTPLKSLNRDLLKRILWWGKRLDFEVSVRHGDTTQYERSMQAQNPSDMLISTPESLQTILVGKVMREHLKNVKWVIVDEIHELVDNKRGIQLSLGLERLRKLTGGFQIISLSATVGSPERVARFLGKDVTVVNAAKQKRISIRVDAPAVRPKDSIASKRMMVSPETAARVRIIQEKIAKATSTLVFTNTRESAEVLSSRLKTISPTTPADVHHSSLSKEVRIAAERDFRDQKLKALLCTSSLELGIDIGSIDFVLQYLSPRQVMKLLQRVGRAGHTLSKVSHGLVLTGDVDDTFEATVIAKRAQDRAIEETKVYENGLDVLGHQIVGMLLEEYELGLDQAYQLVKKVYPYRSLTADRFFEVCRLMERLGVLWINDRDQERVEKYRSGAIPREDRFKDRKPRDLFLRRRRNAWTYYYQNLSTIPDVRSFKIHDVFSNRPVGTLDAEFIAMHGSPGQGVIVKGQAWRILDVGHEKVMVEPMAGIEAAIPAWEGELIPVPYEVAQGVGRLRREIQENGKRAVTFVTKKYPVSNRVARKLVAGNKDVAVLPTDREVVVEYDQEHIIFHTCFGSLVNDTIGRVLSVLLTEKLGSVGLQTDPYRIVLTTAGWGWKEAVQTFLDLKPAQVEKVLRESLPTTELFHWRFLHVAKRLGIIARNAEFGKGYLKKIIEAYEDTPVHEEAFNEIFQDKVDLQKSAEVLEHIKKKQIKVTLKEGLSAVGKRALERRSEIVPPDRPEKEIFGIFKKRLLETRVGLVCCNCGKWASIKEVGRLPKGLKCTKCSSRLISIVPKRYLLDAQQLILKKVQKKRMTKEEKDWLEHTIDLAGLVVASGKEAAIVLAGRGVGLRTAGRILSKMHEGDELLREVLRAERNYVKTRRFWKLD